MQEVPHTFAFFIESGSVWHFKGLHSQESALKVLGEAKHNPSHDRIQVLEVPGGKVAYEWEREERSPVKGT
jgi:hypothetical protein